MYRSIAWKSLQKKAPLDDENMIANIALETKIELVFRTSGQLVFVDGEDITNQLKNKYPNIDISQNQKIIIPNKDIDNNIKFFKTSLSI